MSLLFSSDGSGSLRLPRWVRMATRPIVLAALAALTGLSGWSVWVAKNEAGGPPGDPLLLSSGLSAERAQSLVEGWQAAGRLDAVRHFYHADNYFLCIYPLLGAVCWWWVARRIERPGHLSSRSVAAYVLGWICLLGILVDGSENRACLHVLAAQAHQSCLDLAHRAAVLKWWTGGLAGISVLLVTGYVIKGGIPGILGALGNWIRRIVPPARGAA